MVSASACSRSLYAAAYGAGRIPLIELMFLTIRPPSRRGVRGRVGANTGPHPEAVVGQVDRHVASETAGGAGDQHCQV